MTFLRKVADVYLEGNWKGIVLNSTISVLPGLSFLSLITIALVILRQGIKKGAILTLGTILLSSVLFLIFVGFVGNNEGSLLMNFGGFFTYYLLFFTLSFALACVLRTTVSLQFTLNFLALIFVITSMVVINLNFVQHKVENIMHNYVDQAISTIKEDQKNIDVESGADPEQLNQSLETLNKIKNVDIKQFFPYAIMVMLLLYFITSFVLLLAARMWQANLFNKGGFSKEFLELRASKIFVLIAFVALLEGLLRQFEIFNIQNYLNSTLFFGFESLNTISFIILIITGIAFVHWVVKSLKLNSIILWMLYIMLFFVYTLIYCVLILGLLSAVDSFKNLRHLVIKYRKKGVS